MRKKTDSYKLLLAQAIAHIGLIALLFTGELYHWLIAFTVYFITGCFGMTITYHRLLSHASWNAPKWFEYFGTLAATYGLTGSSIGWVAIHREHHRYTDTPKDPHGPKDKGFIRVQWFSMFEEPNPRYVVKLLKSKFHTFVHKNYFKIHLGIALFWLLIDPMLLLAAYLAPAAILWNMGSFINTITHMFGYRGYDDVDDDSRNVWWLGLLMWGEGWHNNHHAVPNDPRYGRKWWEIDIGYWFIWLLEKKK